MEISDKKKYFVVSDVHSFYNELMTALDKNGFDINNQNHIFVSCGDLFDRGPGSVEVRNFLKSLPKDRRVLVRGNHDFLYQAMLDKYLPEYHDIHNGTLKTVFAFAGFSEEEYKQWFNRYDVSYRINGYIYPKDDKQDSFINDIQYVFNNPVVREHCDWISSDEWVNYFELDKYIMVHSWLPIDGVDYYSINYFEQLEKSTFDTNWRNATMYQWERASWVNPIDYYKSGLYPKDKILINGHFSSFQWRLGLDGMQAPKYNRDDRDLSDKFIAENSSTYMNDHVICLDATTVISGFCNVFVIE